MKNRSSLAGRPQHPRRTRLAPKIGLLGALAVALAACGAAGETADAAQAGATAPDSETDAETGSDTDGGTEGGQSQDDQMLAFYQCLRDNGLDVADPTPGSAVGLGDADPNDPAVQAAIDQCRNDLSMSGPISFGDGNIGENLAETDALLAFVDCMNDNGIVMPDPAPDGRLPLPENQDPNAPEFQDAVRACSSHLGGGGIRIGEPGGGGMVGRGQG